MPANRPMDEQDEYGYTTGDITSLHGDPVWEAIWQAIREWDISRHSNGLYHSTTGTDATRIYEAVKAALPVPPAGTREAVAGVMADYRALIIEGEQPLGDGVYSDWSNRYDAAYEALLALTVPREGEAVPRVTTEDVENIANQLRYWKNEALREGLAGHKQHVALAESWTRILASLTPRDEMPTWDFDAVERQYNALRALGLNDHPDANVRGAVANLHNANRLLASHPGVVASLTPALEGET